MKTPGSMGFELCVSKVLCRLAAMEKVFSSHKPRVKPKTMKIVFVASLLSTHH